MLNSFGYTFRKEGHTKIIEYDLSPKQKEMHQLLNLSRPDVLARDRADSKNVDEGYVGSDDSEMDEDEPAPQASFTDDEKSDDEVDGDVPRNVSPGPARAANGREKSSRGRNERVLTPEECRAHIRRLFFNDSEICSLIFGRHGPLATMNNSLSGKSLASADMFFMDVIPVSPTRFRPPAKLGEILFEHPQNLLLTKVLNTSYRLRDLNVDLRALSVKGADVVASAVAAADRTRILGHLIDSLVQLQVDVNSFMDSNKNPAPMKQGQLPPAGIKQGLEKKEGLFRKHMMVRSFTSSIYQST